MVLQAFFVFLDHAEAKIQKRKSQKQSKLYGPASVFVFLDHVEVKKQKRKSQKQSKLYGPASVFGFPRPCDAKNK